MIKTRLIDFFDGRGQHVSSETVLAVGGSGICNLVYKKMRKVFYLILTGIAIGILIAPGRGSDTWQKIADYLDDLKTKAKNIVNGLTGGTRRMAEERRTVVEKVANKW